MTDSFDSVIKERIKDYFEQECINKPTQNDYGRAFLYFYIRDVASYMNGIYEDDQDDGFDVDGKGDLGVDFLLRREDANLLVVQSKYKGHRSILSADDIANFFQVPKRILNKSFIAQHGNANIKHHLRNTSSEDQIDFVFVTNDKLSQRNKDEFEQQKAIAEAENTNHTFYLKGYSELKKEFATLQTISETNLNQ